MGTGTYHHGDLRNALLDAVAEVVETDGPAAVTLRGTARLAGVSHAAPAHHFGDKQGLLTAFALEGQRRLAATLAAAEADAGGSSRDRLVALGVAYAGFAIAHPAHFQVMSRIDVIDAEDPELRAVAQPNFDRLVRAVRAHQRNGWQATGDPERLAVIVWAQVHGIAQLWLGGFVAPHLAADGIEAFAADMLEMSLGTAADP